MAKRKTRKETFVNKESYGLLNMEIDCNPHFRYWRTNAPREYFGCDNWDEWVKPALGEFLASLFFVFIGAHAMARFRDFRINSGASNDLASWAIQSAVAYGFALIGVTAGFGHISGALVNPSITVASLVTGQIQFFRGIIYIIVQFIGGILGALLVAASMGGRVSGTNIYAGSPIRTALNDGETIVMEFFPTALLVVAYFATAYDQRPDWRRNRGTITAPLVIGLAYTCAQMATIFTSGGGLNPAMVLGTALIGQKFQSYHWIHLVIPLVAGGVAGALYQWFFLDLDQYFLGSMEEDADVAFKGDRALGDDDDDDDDDAYDTEGSEDAGDDDDDDDAYDTEGSGSEDAGEGYSSED